MKKQKVHCYFCNALISRSPTKTGAHFCNTFCKAQWQVLQRENLGYTREWLVEQYFSLGKNCNQIAKEIGRDAKSVWNWFEWYGIELRKRGADSSPGTFERGHKRGVGRIHDESTKEKIRQARLRDGHVPFLKNGEHWLKSISKEFHPNYKGGVTPERQGVYSSKEWSEAVKFVWKRDNATCQICKIRQNECREKKFHIHHIESFANKLKRTDPDNLVLLCPTCHKFVHSKNNKNSLFIKK